MTWQADSQLLRDNVSGYNLSLGEPYFLHDVFKELGIYPTTDLGDYHYPTTAPAPELMEQLRKQFPTGYLVVANGAKQAISAAIEGLLQGDTEYLALKAPYWPSYPTLGNLSSKRLRIINWDPTDVHRQISIDASPNNPDGRTGVEPVDIWDAAYASPVYTSPTKLVIPPKHLVSVWSAAKLYGCSGARVGWLHTEDKNIAEAASRYVEQTTSGVSVNSQRFVARTIKRLENHPEALELAKMRLDQNRSIFKRILPHLKSAVYNAGMFAWFEPSNFSKFSQSLKKSEVRLVTGDVCGGPKTFFRMSLGHRVPYTDEAITKLLKELES